MENDRKTTSIISTELMRSETENLRAGVNLANESLNDFLSLAHASLENWQGKTADEFEKRYESLKAPLDNIISGFLGAIIRLGEISDVYEDSGVHDKSGESGGNLPSDIIY